MENVISKAIKQDVSECYQLLSDCAENLKTNGIFQWDNDYPTIQLVEKDVIKGELYKLILGNQIVATITLNEEQDPAYSTLNWNYLGKT
ncbi:MAG: hypothetical protein JKY42_01540, partial [Flavobacteriales bacterium]|nr:hypothetical protein [Flavobacteriales bacterium]